MNCYHYLIPVILFRTDGQVYRHQGQIRLAAGQVLPAGYTGGPLQLANEEVENFFSSIDPPVPQTVIMSAASVQPPQGHSTFTGEYANVNSTKDSFRDVFTAVTNLRGWARCAPLGQSFYFFMQFAGKKLSNNMFAAPLRVGAPPLGNPGSATALCERQVVVINSLPEKEDGP